MRYVDPKYAGQEEPGFWARMFGNTSNPQAPVRYRVAVKGDDGKTHGVGADLGRRHPTSARTASASSARLVNELR